MLPALYAEPYVEKLLEPFEPIENGSSELGVFERDNRST